MFFRPPDVADRTAVHDWAFLATWATAHGTTTRGVVHDQGRQLTHGRLNDIFWWRSARAMRLPCPRATHNTGDASCPVAEHSAIWYHLFLFTWDTVHCCTGTRETSSQLMKAFKAAYIAVNCTATCRHVVLTVFWSLPPFGFVLKRERINNTNNKVTNSNNSTHTIDNTERAPKTTTMEAPTYHHQIRPVSGNVILQIKRRLLQPGLTPRVRHRALLACVVVHKVVINRKYADTA